MLTKEDKSWVVENFVTRGEFRTDISEIKGTVLHIEELSQKILTIVENFAGNIGTLEQENKMGAVTLRRHGIQIHELATATGTTISE